MKIDKIESGTFLADGGAMFGVVPKKVWQKRYPCDEDNMCILNMRSLVVKTDDRLFLVDTGVGNKQMEYLKYYNIEGVIDYDEELKKLGYSAAKVTDVILTHLHFDHCGACTIYNEDKSEIIPAFPNAKYWLGKRQWENFLSPNVREEDSYFPENMMPVYEAGLLSLVEEDMFIAPEVELRLYEGHSVGQLSPYFHTEKGTLVYTGDVIPFLSAMPIAWVSAYDTFPIKSMENKVKMLREAEEKKQILFFQHDHYNECCTVKEVNGRYRPDEIMTLSDLF